MSKNQAPDTEETEVFCVYASMLIPKGEER